MPIVRLQHAVPIPCPRCQVDEVPLVVEERVVAIEDDQPDDGTDRSCSKDGQTHPVVERPPLFVLRPSGIVRNAGRGRGMLRGHASAVQARRSRKVWRGRFSMDRNQSDLCRVAHRAHVGHAHLVELRCHAFCGKSRFANMQGARILTEEIDNHVEDLV